jgi:uncharacterized protein YceK
MRGMRVKALLAAVVLSLGGCGTVGNLWCPCHGGDRAVYGGVAICVRRAENEAGQAARLDSPWCFGHAAASVFDAVIDLPLSAVGDTLTLPLTIPATLREKREKEADRREVADDRQR